MSFELSSDLEKKTLQMRYTGTVQSDSTVCVDVCLGSGVCVGVCVWGVCVCVCVWVCTVCEGVSGSGSQ